MGMETQEARGNTRHRETKSDTYRKVQIAWLHQQMRFISVLHLLTLSGRFRVGFGVGHISNTIKHKLLALAKLLELTFSNVLASTFNDSPLIFEF